METNYVVIIVHSFDGDVPVYAFGNNYDKAINYLKKSWQEYYDCEKENNSHLDESLCFCEGEYGRVTWDDGCSTEFILSYISDPGKE